MKKTLFTLLCTVLVLSMLMGMLASCTVAPNTDGNPDTENGGNTNENGGDGTVDENESKYNAALGLIASGDYEGAYAAFEALGDYKDSKTHLDRFVYFPSVASYELSDRSGVMTVTLGEFNLPHKIVSEGTVGIKDGTLTYDEKGNVIRQAQEYQGSLATYDYTYDENN
jgi:hypothetical protein